ncbi:hypothetical protein F5X96DRAFT_95131 [Biscogniauxia mediterranea]|nr:hypothetical protein F5X96DRAFT_95131 [Biscogniauxia mediterranea]
MGHCFKMAHLWFLLATKLCRQETLHSCCAGNMSASSSNKGGPHLLLLVWAKFLSSSFCTSVAVVSRPPIFNLQISYIL